ncbi:MAG: hypothetical protein AB1782_17815 [Cyanobacteriota bacterium]
MKLSLYAIQLLIIITIIIWQPALFAQDNTKTAPININATVLPQIKLKQKITESDSFLINNIKFSEQGKYFAAFFNGKKTIKIFNSETGVMVSELGPELLFKNKSIDTLQFIGKDSSLLLVTKGRQPIKIIKWKEKKIKTEIALNINSFKINDVVLSPDNKILAVAHQKGLYILDFTQFKTHWAFFDNEDIRAIDISPDNKYLVYAKAGLSVDCVGMINLTLFEITDKPLEKLHLLSSTQALNHEIVYLDYINTNKILAAYQGIDTLYYSDQKAGLYIINLEKNILRGPLILSGPKISMVSYLKLYDGILASSFGYKRDGTIISDIDYANILRFDKIKTYIDLSLKNPILDVSVSPDSKTMVTAIKEKNGVSLYIYSLIKQEE